MRFWVANPLPFRAPNPSTSPEMQFGSVTSLVEEQIFLTKNRLIMVGLPFRGNVGVGGTPFVICDIAGCCASVLKEVLVQLVVPPVGLQPLTFSVSEAVL